jgi:hypothetical protein
MKIMLSLIALGLGGSSLAQAQDLLRSVDFKVI